MKLQEWSKGKGIVMMDRLFKVLSKRTGETYQICHIPTIYQNKYGKFVGYFVVSNTGKVYRANFIVNASSEEVVSLDMFAKGDKKRITPQETLSFEGYNIVQIYNCVLDWMRGNGKALTANGFKESVALHEGKWNDVMAQFLQAQPNWIKDSQTGTMDQALFFKTYKDFCKTNGIPGDPGPISYAMKTFQATLASGASGSAGKSAAKSVAIPLAVPGAPSKPIPTDDELIQKYSGGDAKGFNDFFGNLDSPKAKGNPMAEINRYKKYIKAMANAPEYTKAGVVAWGKGGTGKTHHAETSLQSEGMSNGVNYRTIDNLKGGVEVFIGQVYDAVEDGMSFIILDDCDVIFTDKYRNWMLHILADKASQRVVHIDQAGIKSPKGRDIPAGTEIDVSEVKFIFCTNKDVTLLDGAWKSRIESINFDFTDEEMLMLIKDALNGLMADDPILTDADKLKVYNLLSAATEKGVAKNVNFRTMNACLQAWCLAKLLGENPYAAVGEAVRGNI